MRYWLGWGSISQHAFAFSLFISQRNADTFTQTMILNEKKDQPPFYDLWITVILLFSFLNSNNSESKPLLNHIGAREHRPKYFTWFTWSSLNMGKESQAEMLDLYLKKEKGTINACFSKNIYSFPAWQRGVRLYEVIFWFLAGNLLFNSWKSIRSTN